ncbi:MAG: hypothetical protein IPI58_05825 [Alphaproteobacteria bacterium]|nr:MAG: hypothetical protein IPI58_05825 [Alphaproteobacteria bacterium]
MTEIFLTQQTGEVLHRPAAPGLRLTQTTAEVLRRPATSRILTSQTVIEALRRNGPAATAQGFVFVVSC